VDNRFESSYIERTVIYGSRVTILTILFPIDRSHRQIHRMAQASSSSRALDSDWPAFQIAGEESLRYLQTDARAHRGERRWQALPHCPTADGTFIDLQNPKMGSARTRFGRNVPLEDAYPNESGVLTPNPRTVSQELLTRDTFKPATLMNLLAAAWIQFMIHDWFSHGKNQKEHPWEVPLQEDDPWYEHPMRILRTHRDPTHSPDSDDLPPTYLNIATAWWDGSQLYGSDAETQAKVRSGEDGKLTIGPDGLLPSDPHSGVEITGVNGNWWIGLSMMHTLFTR
jgi:Animal haem peroxidase